MAQKFGTPPGGIVGKGLVYTEEQVAQQQQRVAEGRAERWSSELASKGSYVSIGGRLYPMWWLLAGGGALLLGGIFIVTR